MSLIKIPSYSDLKLHWLVCDFNGTIAKDGILLPQIIELFDLIGREYKIFVITADTFGTVKKQLHKSCAEVIVLQSDNHTQEKADLIEKLGLEQTIAIGNGNNDKLMLLHAKIGIALLGDEGCATQTLLASDIVVKNIYEALELLIYPKRLIATLRK